MKMMMSPHAGEHAGENLKLLKAEFDRVQVALGDFYHANDTRNITISTLTLDLHAVIPRSTHFDVRVRMGCGDALIYATSLDIVIGKLSIPNIANEKAWCSILLEEFLEGDTAVIDGRVCTELECFVHILEANPFLEELWFELGKILEEDDAEVAINEHNFSTGVVAIDVSSTAAWGDLDNVLAEGARAFERPPITALGRPYTSTDCLIKVVEVNPSSLCGWLCLTSSLPIVDDECVEVNGITLDAKDCCLKILELDPLQSQAWFTVGAAIQKPKKTVYIHGVPYTTKECYVKGLELCPRHKVMWCNLAFVLQNEKNEHASGGAFHMSVTVGGMLYPQLSASWFMLARTLNDTDTVTINGRSYTTQHCYVELLQIEPENGYSWSSLGSLIKSGNAVVVDGTTFTSRQCQLKAIELKPHHSEAWIHLGNDLATTRDSVLINGKSYNDKQCFIRSVEMDPRANDGWYCLGKALQRTPNQLQS